MADPRHLGAIGTGHDFGLLDPSLFTVPFPQLLHHLIDGVAMLIRILLGHVLAEKLGAPSD
jgi:hypothetical protein